MSNDRAQRAERIVHVGFAQLMGIELTQVTPDLVRASLKIRPDLCTTGDIMHGGAVLAFADTLGAIGASLNLPGDATGTTTTESKTIFLSGAPVDSVLLGEATPVKIGRRLSVWQTRLTTPQGKLIALVTQSQMVL